MGNTDRSSSMLSSSFLCDTFILLFGYSLNFQSCMRPLLASMKFSAHSASTKKPVQSLTRALRIRISFVSWTSCAASRLSRYLIHLIGPLLYSKYLLESNRTYQHSFEVFMSPSFRPSTMVELILFNDTVVLVHGTEVESILPLYRTFALPVADCPFLFAPHLN